MTLRSFRDPDGFVTDDGVTISRTIAPAAAARCRELLASRLYGDLVRDRWLIPAASVTELADGGIQVLHPRVRMPVYPSEWTGSMLAAAARRTLQIQSRAWQHGWTLKDAAASNILFDGGNPRLCDLMSLEARQADVAPRWTAYGQFVRQFVIPLLLAVDSGVTPREVFLAHRDGVRASEVLGRLSWWCRLRPGVFLHVVLPAWLERRQRPAPTRKTAVRQPPAAPGLPAGDPVLWTLRSLQGLVAGLARTARRKSQWSEYEQERSHYAPTSLQHKREFIEVQLQRQRPRHVLDIGANSGEYSLLALQGGAAVVALDDDAPVLDGLFVHADGRGPGLTCLHANFARPTPPTGWQLRESLSLQARMSAAFDMVIAVAVLHHLLVTERLPVASLMEELHACCTDTLVIEFVARDDPKFIEIAALNQGLYQDWSLDVFLKASAAWFEVIEQETLRDTPTRTLLAMRRKAV